MITEYSVGLITDNKLKGVTDDIKTEMSKFNINKNRGD
jgi:hypothetical protein